MSKFRFRTSRRQAALLALGVSGCTSNQYWQPADPVGFTSPGSSQAFGRPVSRQPRAEQESGVGVGAGPTGALSATERGLGSSSGSATTNALALPSLTNGYLRSAGDGGWSVYVDPSLAADLSLLAATPQDPGAPQQDKSVSDDRWVDFLPFGGTRALALGYDLPFAIGVGVNYAYTERDIVVESLEVGLNGPPTQNIGFVDVASETRSEVVVGRVDAWILPFLNVYGTFGHLWNTVDSTVTFNLPGIGPIPPQSIPVALPSAPDAPIYGGGVSLSTGFDNGFASCDGIYQVSDFSQFDEEVRVFLVTSRIGWRGKLAEDTRIRVWGGGTYWDTARTIEGSIPLGSDTLSYSVAQAPVTEWSYLLGTNIEFEKHYSLVFEAQYNRDVRVLLVGGAFRF